MHKLLAGEVLHAFSHLQAEAHEILHRGVLQREQTRGPFLLKNSQPGKRCVVHTTRCMKAERTWLSSRMKLRRSPCFMYGSTTRGEPSLGRQIPSRDSTLGWLKSFMMIPSFRNWDTSSISVIPAVGTQHNFTTFLLL